MDARVLASIVGAILFVGFVGVAAVALVGSRSAGRPSSQVPPTSVVEPIGTGDGAGEEEPLVAQPTRPATTPTPAPSPTEQEIEYVRIANTGGSGAFIRREAASNSPGIVAYRDGIVLKVVGPDVTTSGRAWRQVEDRQGNRGWTPREYLEPSPVGF